MQAWNFNSDEGSAVIELLGFGVLLQVPILMFATSMAELQRNQLAAQTMSIQSLRSYLRASNSNSAISALERSLAEMRMSFALPAEAIDYSLKTNLVDGVRFVSLRVAIGQANEVSTMVQP